MKTRLSILNVYCFPDQDYDGLNPGMTPVNTFRVVLNQYLGNDYDLLEDASYYSSYDRPYAFVDVTEQLLPSAE